jgi:SAM-dependent methyltransferase
MNSAPDEYFTDRATASLMKGALVDLCGLGLKSRVLDFGCGAGGLVKDLSKLGFDAYGCDIAPRWPESETLRVIGREPFRIPFPEHHFDAVISVSVMEHAQNKDECFREIHRVLRPGGYALHLFPAKWYLPVEPHLYVPLLNYSLPRVPRTWLYLFALAGVRNHHQAGMRWRDAAQWAIRYCEDRLDYRPTGYYEELATKVFGNYLWPMEYFTEHSCGGYSRLVRNVPLRRFWAWLGREIRMAFLVTRRLDA